MGKHIQADNRKIVHKRDSGPTPEFLIALKQSEKLVRRDFSQEAVKYYWDEYSHRFTAESPINQSGLNNIVKFHLGNPYA